MSLNSISLALQLVAFVILPVKGANLDVYVIDVEGGQATLFVSPSGQSMLVDAGYKGFDGRDADRIVSTARTAKLKRIDFVVITHYHRDHVGGVPQLAQRIPIGTFVDHGALMEESANAKEDFADYERTLPVAEHRFIVKAGDAIPIKDLRVEVLTSAGKSIRSALPKAGQANPFCNVTERHNDDPSENARSVGMLVTFGRFRLLDLGDLTWNKELDLMCPNNLIGLADVYLVSHHGLALSGSPALVHGLHARAAIISNGPKKGAAPSAWQIIRDSPGMEDIWQIHYAAGNDREHNASEDLIANTSEACEAKYIKISAWKDGSFRVMNSRNNYQKQYGSRSMVSGSR